MFSVTAFFSIFAYIWLLLILVVISPHVVEIWEAVITFLLFPLLVGISYAADKGMCNVKLAPKNTKQMEVDSTAGIIIIIIIYPLNTEIMFLFDF